MGILRIWGGLCQMCELKSYQRWAIPFSGFEAVTFVDSIPLGNITLTVLAQRAYFPFTLGFRVLFTRFMTHSGLN